MEIDDFLTSYRIFDILNINLNNLYIFLKDFERIIRIRI
jgi:hypothetical protein